MNNTNEVTVLLSNGFDDVTFDPHSDEQMKLLRKVVSELTADRTSHYLVTTDGPPRLFLPIERVASLRSRLSQVIDSE